ncbi:uncharacterized protein BDCG_16476 [Blastomyces dermatitidis ER-3]|uniref:Uncharacterized protein n=1 Tax=Ajellomyces dermatitidis (strain ER-3 / ATCC MYA-2586) TaxID=559297 RepID=A0ABX2VSC1_AJEDR|nr:uncharacterized protein BDCG_16476 [Blastomyces dermatitidis ER-3]OAT00107.1 hypothetical protein BDCG_16476 [Blastomyces dermatitidis ER-3]
MSFLFKYSAVLRIIKARECCHRLKREKKKVFKCRETDSKIYYNALKRLYDTVYERLKKKIVKSLIQQQSQMHFMIQNIEKAALLSEHVNLLITEMKPETADQEMRDFEMQVNLAEGEQ